MRTALSECGTILEENIEDGIISGVILSGAANMNPAFLLLKADGTSIHLAVNEKDGLIKQHTAERAIDAFKSAFANAKGS
jgi:predicted esterase